MEAYKMEDFILLSGCADFRGKGGGRDNFYFQIKPGIYISLGFYFLCEAVKKLMNMNEQCSGWGGDDSDNNLKICHNSLMKKSATPFTREKTDPPPPPN